MICDFVNLYENAPVERGCVTFSRCLREIFWSGSFDVASSLDLSFVRTLTLLGYPLPHRPRNPHSLQQNQATNINHHSYSLLSPITTRSHSQSHAMTPEIIILNPIHPSISLIVRNV